VSDDTDTRRYISLLLEEETIRRIDTFAALNRFSSRTQALRWLINFSLDRNPKLELKESKRRKIDPWP
jgi:metal-responsive CopG/Arc/MetJ family transcriptional regulator